MEKQPYNSRVKRMYQGVHRIVLSNAPWYRRNPGDEASYNISPSALEFLSLIAINLALPTLTGLATNWIYDKLKEKLNQNKDYNDPVSKEDLEEEVCRILSEKLTKQISSKDQEDAIKEVETLLLYHGCPSRKVKDLSEGIVGVIISVLEENG